MRQTWRWFGPKDLVSIDDMLQAGVEGVVTALHHVPTGEVWTAGEIERRRNEIARMTDGAPSGLAWEVVESLPVSEDIKKQKGAWRAHLDNYKLSLGNLAAAGIEVICYNFMPELDWTRTDLAWRLRSGATCMRFDYADFAVFDIHLLGRDGAPGDFSEAVVEDAARRFAAMDDAARKKLVENIVCGLPGAAEHFTLADVRNHLAEYEKISTDGLRAHLVAFLENVVPVAEKLGLRLCCHPDDPPFPLLGLPRIMSTEADYRTVMDAVDSPANGASRFAPARSARVPTTICPA
jgi:mannonate dehydratase